ncbi:MAG: ribosome-associated translation inhibitor RaiA [Ignavibacteria bacterium]|nr:ribosome-associated translation inhibitor RaiA [Ignavibacteriota bacterium]
MIKINITSRHFKAHETLQDYIKNEIETLSKYHEEILHADVILSYEKAVNSIKSCEINIKLRDKLIAASESSDDYHKSIDKAIDKIETQLLKYKSKNKKEKNNIKKEIIKTI